MEKGILEGGRVFEVEEVLTEAEVNSELGMQNITYYYLSQEGLTRRRRGAKPRIRSLTEAQSSRRTRRRGKDLRRSSRGGAYSGKN